MAHRTLSYGLWLGLVGFALAGGCVVKSSDDDGTGDAGAAGESSGGSSTGGSSTGGSSTGGKSTGGSSTGGSNTGGSSGSGTGGSGGSMGGSSGSGPVDTSPTCDPAEGQIDSTPYENCTARAGNECEACIEGACCDESKICYGTDDYNVCGWGGLNLDDDPALDGEITCYVQCASEYVAENDGVYDDEGVDLCTAMCATEECGLIGNATQDLVECIVLSCSPECFGTT